MTATDCARRDAYRISTDKTELDLILIHRFLSESSYWAADRSRVVVEKSIAHSLCFGVYVDRTQIGFARVVTDHATFAWLCDVFVVDAHRGRGIGQWLIKYVTAHPDLNGISRFLLATRDAHELYRRYGGFQALKAPEMWMARS